MREELPSLEVSDLDGVTCWSRTDEGLPKLDQQDGKFVHVSKIKGVASKSRAGNGTNRVVVDVTHATVSVYL